MAGNNDDSNFIIDSSFLLSYLLPDENIKKVQKFFDSLKIRKINMCAPVILPFEVLNGLKMAVSRKRIDEDLAHDLGRKFLKIPIQFIPVDFMDTFLLANKHELTLYDASYLYLAKKQKMDLLTMDEKLKKL